jgi:hypothetical protein
MAESVREKVFQAVSRPYGRIAAVTAALDAGFPATATDDFGCTLLHYVPYVYYKLQPLVPRLLASGWDPNARNHSGATPMHDACVCGELGFLQVLVAGGGRLNAPDVKGRTPVFYASHKPHLLEWLATRPEVDWCHVANDGFTVLEELEDAEMEDWLKQPCTAIVAGAVAAQRRWSPLRAAFVGVAVMAVRK